MNEPGQIPTYAEDQKEFKIIASKLGVTMKELFHKWIQQHRDSDVE